MFVLLVQVMGEEAQEPAAAADPAAAGSSRAAEAGSSAAGAGEAAAAGKASPAQQAQQETGGARSSAAVEAVDTEMEDRLVQTVRKRVGEDPLSAYDLDVEEDGEAITLYLSLLDSAAAAAAGGNPAAV